MAVPDPRAEIRLLSLRSLPGANFWSSRPVTRLDLVVGAFDEISSAEVAGFTDALVAALPGLWEHRCSVGERGGFVTRLRRGTYAPHIIEHVSLELQSQAGHNVGYGRARGGDRPGEYTVVFEHLHSRVGRRAAEIALDAVSSAFAGVPVDFAPAIAELRALASSPDAPGPTRRVLCGIIGGALRAETRLAMLREGAPDPDAVVDVAPLALLEAGLPYARSETAVILDAQLDAVPERYREAEMAARLVSVLADAVRPDGLVVVPAGEPEIHERVRDAGCRVAVFSTDQKIPPLDARLAHATARVQDGRIVLECLGRVHLGGPLRADVPPEAQVAAALARFCLHEAGPDISSSSAGSLKRAATI